MFPTITFKKCIPRSDHKTHNLPRTLLFSPIVVTVKKDHTIKLALSSKNLNKAIHKNKYRTPNIEKLIETISEQVSNPALQRTTIFQLLISYLCIAK